MLYDRTGAVAVLTLNRGKKLNALRKKTIGELPDLLGKVEEIRKAGIITEGNP